MAETKKQGEEAVAAPARKNRVYPKYNLGSKQFRPWLVEVLLGGGMYAGQVYQLAEEHFKDKMIEGDLIPKFSGDGKRQQFKYAWQHRLYCAREGMVKAGLMHETKHFPDRPSYWALTPKGKDEAHRSGY